MRWKTKARIQKAIALLPDQLSYPVHYWIQRRLGGLRTTDPMWRIEAGFEVCRRLREHGARSVDATFLEVGTGHRVNMPIAFWLAGARRVITVDANRYLQSELVRDDVRAIVQNAPAIRRFLAALECPDGRVEEIGAFAGASWSLPRFLEMCQIEYLAPRDARDLHSIDNDSVDVHTSYTVLEHIAPEYLPDVIREGSRVLRENGLFVHLIDHTDHFSHDDNRISTINFLRYSEAEWARYAGNRYAYTNRLRVDDFERLFTECGHEILSLDSDLDVEARRSIEEGRFPLDDRFSAKPARVIAAKHTWLVSTPRAAQEQASRRPRSAS